MATDNKYDRQLRLWGENGQKSLSNSRILLINATPAGTETLKNLVLPGIGHFCILDGNKVTSRDLGNNFFVSADYLGHSRAKAAKDLLSELNSDVNGDFLEANPADIIASRREFFSAFTLIISTDLTLSANAELRKICHQNKIGLITLGTYGFIGYMRIFLDELTVVESLPSDRVEDDLRLTAPFKELADFIGGFDIDSLPDNLHGHVPYAIILIRAIEQWKKLHNGVMPSNFAEKEQFKALIKSGARDYGAQENFIEAVANSHKCFQSLKLSEDLENIFHNPKINKKGEVSSFWLLAAALKGFYEKTGTLPLSGKIPDMTSDTETYIKIQHMYQHKAETDIELFQSILESVLKSRNIPPQSITKDEVKLFCQNANFLQVHQYRGDEALYSDNDKKEDLLNELGDDESLIKWFIAIQAYEVHRDKNVSNPLGENANNFQSDVETLRTHVTGLLQAILPNHNAGGAKIEDKYIEEMIRAGPAKVHNIAAFLGGVASQEAVKIIAQKFTPINNTFIYDGIRALGWVFEF